MLKTRIGVGLAYALAAIFIVDLPLLGGAQTLNDVALLALPAAGSETSPFEGVIRESLRQDLDRRGFRPVVLSQDRSPGASGLVPETLLASREAGGALYLILAEYFIAEPLVTLRLSLYEGGKEAVSARVERQGRTDLTLDRSVFAALGGLLDQAGISPSRPDAAAAPSDPAAAPEMQGLGQGAAADPRALNPAGTAPAAPGAQGAAPGAAAGPAQGSNQGSVPGSPGQPDTASAPAGGSSVTPEAAGTQDPAPVLQTNLRPRRTGLELAAGGAPIVPAGVLGTFFQAGGMGSLRAGWRFAVPYVDITPGLAVSVMAFSAKGPLDSASGLLIPLGAEVRVGLPANGGPVAPYLVLGGGAAFLRLSTDRAGDYFAVWPFFGLGPGLSWPLWGDVEMGISVPFSLFFDGGDAIMAVNPGLEIVVPLGGEG